MAGRGPAPKENRVRRVEPERGEIVAAEAPAWRGDIPAPPEGLMPASVEAWNTWFGAWFAAFWSPADLPGIRHMIRLHDQVERGEFQRSTELRMTMDTYGVTPKGAAGSSLEAPGGPVGAGWRAEAFGRALCAPACGLMPWRGPEHPDDFPSLGWGLLDWWAEFLPSPRDPLAPLIFTDEQALQLIEWYRLHPVTGERVYRRGYSRRSKGWGKSPVEAAKAIAELRGPVRFGGWDANGEPVGRPWSKPTPLIQIAAVSLDQTDNTYGALQELLGEDDGTAADLLGLDVGVTGAIRLPDPLVADLEADPTDGLAVGVRIVTLPAAGAAHLVQPLHHIAGIEIRERQAALLHLSKQRVSQLAAKLGCPARSFQARGAASVRDEAERRGLLVARKPGG